MPQALVDYQRRRHVSPTLAGEAVLASVVADEHIARAFALGQGGGLEAAEALEFVDRLLSSDDDELRQAGRSICERLSRMTWLRPVLAEGKMAVPVAVRSAVLQPPLPPPRWSGPLEIRNLGEAFRTEFPDLLDQYIEEREIHAEDGDPFGEMKRYPGLGPRFWVLFRRGLAQRSSDAAFLERAFDFTERMMMSEDIAVLSAGEDVCEAIFRDEELQALVVRYAGPATAQQVRDWLG